LKSIANSKYYQFYEAIFPTQKFEKTLFVIPKGHFVTKKGGFVMVAPEKEIFGLSLRFKPQYEIVILMK